MKHLFKFFVAFLGNQVFAQNNQRFFQKIEFKNNTAEISVNDGLYQVKFYTPEMVRNGFYPKKSNTYRKFSRRNSFTKRCKIQLQEKPEVLHGLKLLELP